MYILAYGTIIQEDRLLNGHAIVVEDDRITAIISNERAEKLGPEYQRIDCSGGYLSPGFVDIHSDYIENLVAPRPTSMIDFRIGLKESERILITHGITTMYHSLSLYKDQDFGVKEIRRPANVSRLINTISGMHDIDHVIRHRVHARFEVNNFDMVEQVGEFIEEGKIHLISFMDHTPGQGQYRDLEIYRKTIRGYQDMTAAEAEVVIATRQTREKLQVEQIIEIADLALSHGVAVASHDDDSIEKLDLVKQFGATISEFPISLEVARRATEDGLWTIAGAPNVLMGGSHSGNLSAVEGIKDGSISILCSDYYPSALIHALFIMHEQHGIPLPDMFRMVSLNPAKAVGIEDTVGSLAAGKKADILLVGIKDGYPMVNAAMVDGKVVYRTEYRK